MTDLPSPDSAAKEAHAWRPERFMVITAHPDDSEFGPAAWAILEREVGKLG